MLKKIDCISRSVLIMLVTIYQKVFSPDHSFWAKFLIPYGHCKYYPTCSAYAKEALTIYNLPESIKFIFIRLSRCHPWSKGGFDYLPTHKQN